MCIKENKAVRFLGQGDHRQATTVGKYRGEKRMGGNYPALTQRDHMSMDKYRKSQRRRRENKTSRQALFDERGKNKKHIRMGREGTIGRGKEVE